MGSTAPTDGAGLAAEGHASGLSLPEQFKTTSDSSDMDDSEFEDAVQTALGNALEDIFETRRETSRPGRPRSAAWGIETAPRKRPPSAGLRRRLSESPARKEQNPDELREKLEKKEREATERRRGACLKKSGKNKKRRHLANVGKPLTPSSSKEVLDYKQRRADERRKARRDEKKRRQKEHLRLVNERCQARNAEVEEMMREAHLRAGMMHSGKCGIAWNITDSSEIDTSLTLPPILPLTADDQAELFVSKETISNADARDAWMAQASDLDQQIEGSLPGSPEVKKGSLVSEEAEDNSRSQEDVCEKDEDLTLVSDKVLADLMGFISDDEDKALSEAIVSAMTGEATKKKGFLQKFRDFFKRIAADGKKTKVSKDKKPEKKRNLFGCMFPHRHSNAVAPEPAQQDKLISSVKSANSKESKPTKPKCNSKESKPTKPKCNSKESKPTKPKCNSEEGKSIKPKKPSSLTRIRKRGKVTPQCALGFELKWHEKIMLWCY